MNPYPDLGPGSFTGAGIDAATPLYDQLIATSDGREPESPEPDKRTGRQKLMAFFGLHD